MSTAQDGTSSAILAIDDEASILVLVKTVLEGDGYVVHTAVTPQQGISLYAEHWRNIKLVLLDFSMPGMTGDLVFQQLTQINPDVQVLLVSAHCSAANKTSFGPGMRGCLAKPFRLSELLNQVRAVVDPDRAKVTG